MAPKKKATTLSLSELQNILKEQTGTTTEGTSTKTTWAEDEFELPSARKNLIISSLNFFFHFLFSLVHDG